MIEPFDGDFLVACVDMLGRTGAKFFEISYDDDVSPVMWTASVTHKGHKEWVQSDDPEAAVGGLLIKICEGGQCAHCGRVIDVVVPDEEPMRDCCGLLLVEEPKLRWTNGCLLKETA